MHVIIFLCLLQSRGEKHHFPYHPAKINRLNVFLLWMSRYTSNKIFVVLDHFARNERLIAFCDAKYAVEETTQQTFLKTKVQLPFLLGEKNYYYLVFVRILHFFAINNHTKMHSCQIDLVAINFMLLITCILVLKFQSNLWSKVNEAQNTVKIMNFGRFHVFSPL